MKLQHWGVTIELPAGDPRIPIIEAVLFGKTLPPFLDAPEASSKRPKPELPEAYRAFWAELQPIEQKELLLLIERPYRPEEIEKALGLTQRKLMGQHSTINRFASKHRVPLDVRSSGRVRKSRRYYVIPEAAGVLRALASQ